MATRITVFESHVGIKGKVGHTFKKRYCDQCGHDVRSVFSCKCETCGATFTEQQHVFIPEKEESYV